MTNWWEGGKPDAVAPYAGGKLPGVDADGNGVVYPADGLSAGAAVVRAFPFAFDTPDLLTGAALYTPTPGDILLDAWIEIDTAWDGTTPLFDVGTFSGLNSGVFGSSTGALDMSVADLDEAPFNLRIGVSRSSLAQSVMVSQAANTLKVSGVDLHFVPGFFIRLAPARFIDATPIKVCVSQDGTNTGDDPASTQGAAVLFLVTATPVGA